MNTEDQTNNQNLLTNGYYMLPMNSESEPSDFEEKVSKLKNIFSSKSIDDCRRALKMSRYSLNRATLFILNGNTNVRRAKESPIPRIKRLKIHFVNDPKKAQL